MASSKIPTTDQVFGAWTALFDLICKQPPRGPGDPLLSFAMRLGHEPPGSLTSIALRGDAAAAYRSLQKTMWAAAQWGRAGSVESLTALAKRFILEMAVDVGSGRRAIRSRYRELLESQIGGPLKKWRVVARAPARFRGGVLDFALVGLRFRSMGEQQLVALKQHLRRGVGTVARARMDLICREFETLQGRDLTCMVDVEARNADVAFLISRELIADRLDCLAGVAALCREPRIGASDPRDWGDSRIALELHGNEAQGTLFPRDPSEVDLSDIVASRNDARIRTLLRLIAKPNRRDGERRLRTALRWYGRSHRATSEVTAYLHGMIAFETLLKGANEGGIGAGLRLRYAQLRGTTRAVRRRLKDEFGDLYDKRSAIVHARDDQVDYAELVQLRTVVQSAMSAYMLRGFHRKDEAAIARWFEDQAL